MSNIQTLAKMAESQLLKGDTKASQITFSKLANFLIAEANKISDSHFNSLLRIQAGIAFFEGGHYSDSMNILHAVQRMYLDDYWDQQWQRYYFEAKVRCGTANWAKARLILIKAYEMEGRWSELLDVLSSSPYVIPPKSLTALRAKACRELGNEKLAELFEQDARSL